MITEFFLNIIFNIAYGALSILPDFNWTVSASWTGFIQDAMSVVSFFLPMGTVTAIISLICGLISIRVVIAIVKTIWDLLPLV